MQAIISEFTEITGAIQRFEKQLQQSRIRIDMCLRNNKLNKMHIHFNNKAD